MRAFLVIFLSLSCAAMAEQQTSAPCSKASLKGLSLSKSPQSCGIEEIDLSKIDMMID